MLQDIVSISLVNCFRPCLLLSGDTDAADAAAGVYHLLVTVHRRTALCRVQVSSLCK